MSEQKKEINESGLVSIGLDKRESWVQPALVWAGCEFSITVIMTGTGIISAFTFKEFMILLLFSILGFTWITDGFNSYMGALSGRSSGVIARSSFGSQQAKYLISILVAFNLIGWWAINTAITGNAICTIFNIDYTVQRGFWIMATIFAGVLFTIPPVLGYTSIKWIDYFAVPGGIILCFSGLYLAIRNIGSISELINIQPSGTMLRSEAVGLFIGANVSQLIIMADYTRFCKPKIKDAFLVPSLLVITGIALFALGAVMGAGRGSFDLVQVMKELGFGWWGFLILWLAQWTSQLVAIYSMGLCLTNMFDANTEKKRQFYTILGSLVGLMVALLGILNNFTNFLILTGLVYPAVGSIMVVDFFLINKKEWRDKEGWNWVASISLAIGVLIGYYTQYVYKIGIPAAQSYIFTGIAYYAITYIKAKNLPDVYSPKRWLN